MEVQHSENKDSHSIVGGGNIRSYGIANNAEFITMLSEGMYSKKKMAAVREVMCNAHDSHVNSGIDIPIEVTLTQETLTIRDFGSGIDDAVIEPIYCIYGNSTKVNSSLETGGFGLGSKAPFAYVDHFKVVSAYKGIKTTYVSSRGSTETDGKPDFRTIVSTPTTESGLTVSWKLKSPSDYEEFSNLIKYLTYTGDMNVKFNGTVLPIMNLSNCIDQFDILNNDPIIDTQTIESSIYIQYGSVVYPVSIDKDIEKLISPLNKYTKKHYYSGGTKSILFMKALPDTISVTPSRESLSLTKMTKTTIASLLTDTINSLQSRTIDVAKNVVYDCLKATMSNPDSDKNPINFFASLDFKYLDKPDVIENDALYRAILYGFYDLSSTINGRNIAFYEYLLDLFSIMDSRNKLIYKSARRVICNKKGNYRSFIVNDKFIKYSNKLILDRIKTNFGEYYYRLKVYKLNTRNSNGTFVSFDSNISTKSYNDLKYNTYSGIIDDSSIIYSNSIQGLLDYSDTNKVKEGELAIYHTKKQGMSQAISDIIEKYAFVRKYDHTSFVYIAPDKEVKATVSNVEPVKRPGYTLLRSVYGVNYLKNINLNDPKNERTEEPKIVVVRSKGSYHDTIEDLDNTHVKCLLHFFGSSTVIVSNSGVKDNVELKYPNCIRPFKALWNLVVNYYTISPNFANAVKSLHFKNQPIISNLINISKFDPDLKKNLGIHYTLNSDEKVLFEFVKGLSRNDRYNKIYRGKDHEIVSDFFTKAFAELDKNLFLQSLISNKKLEFIDTDAIANLAQNSNTLNPELSDLITIVNLLI